MASCVCMCVPPNFRHEKIAKLCAVMGNELPEDRDTSYELTTDNAKKILAIHMRFRYNKPLSLLL